MKHKHLLSTFIVGASLVASVACAPAAFADEVSPADATALPQFAEAIDGEDAIAQAADAPAEKGAAEGTEPAVAEGEFAVAEDATEESADAISATGTVPDAEMPDATAAMGTVPDAETAAPTDQAISLGSQANGLAAGIYVIASALDQNKSLDVPGASGANSVPVNIYDQNTTPAQRWSIIATDDGYYEIVSVSSGKALDVAGGSKANGATVQQYTRNQTNAQKWNIVETGSGLYKIVSALSSSIALDVAGGSKANGTRVQIWEDNGTAAQKWALISAQAIDDGFYVVENAGSGKVLDVANGSTSDGANIQQYAKNGTPAQSFYFTYDEQDGYYTLTDLGSGKVLDVAGGASWNGGNVNQYAYNGTRAQKWAVVKASDGSFTLRSSISGLALDVSGASKANGANVQVFASNNTPAQKWSLVSANHALAEGTYEVTSSKNPANAIDVSGGSTASGANLQLYLANSSNAQKFYLRPSSNGTFTLQNPVSGLYLNAAKSQSGANVALGTAEQRFKIVFGPGGYELALADAPTLVLDVAGGSTASGANLQLYKANQTMAQRFILKSTSMFSNGLYAIRYALNTGFVLDVPGASSADGLALHLYEDNGTNAQRFTIRKAGDDVYVIQSACSSKYLEAAAGDGGSRVVKQAVSSATDSQYWKFVLAKDGTLGIVPHSSASERLTAASGAQNYSAAILAKSNGGVSQRWKITREYSNSAYDYLNLTLERMAALNSVSANVLDPDAVDRTQFLDLRIATSVTAGELDSFIASTNLGRQGYLANLGWAFVQAAQQYGLNEVYLLAHAILESAWGTSELASGYKFDGGMIDDKWYEAGTYYNFYGIGAFDDSPLSGGRKLAIINGWNTPQEAVLGAARWIASNYTYASSYPQPTLYAMKWDYARTSASGSRGWHQYATSVTWSDSIARIINQCYSFVGKASSATYVVPVYL